MRKPKVQTFSQLVQWIAEHHHDGSVLPIAGRIGVSGGLVGFWARGETRQPKIENLQRLAEVYDLDFFWLLSLVHGKRLAPISGGSDIVQALSEGDVVNALSLIGHRLLRLVRPMQPLTWAAA